MKKLIHAFLVFVAFTGVVSAKTDPSAYLEGIANNMISVIEKNKEALKTDTKLAEELVRKHLLPAIDKEAFAQKTLGSKTWDSLTESQKKSFIDSYIQNVINKYAKGLSLYDGQAFVFEKTEYSKKSDNARVKSELKQIGSEPLGIYYYVRPDNDNWLITNMVIGGSSVTKSYKTQYLPRIKEIGMEKFLEELASKQAAE